MRRVLTPDDRQTLAGWLRLARGPIMEAGRALGGIVAASGVADTEGLSETEGLALPIAQLRDGIDALIARLDARPPAASPLDTPRPSPPIVDRKRLAANDRDD